MQRGTRNKIIIIILVTLCLTFPFSVNYIEAAQFLDKSAYMPYLKYLDIETDRSTISEWLSKIFVYLILIFSLPIIKSQQIYWIRVYKEDILKILKFLLPNKYKGNYVDSILAS